MTEREFLSIIREAKATELVLELQREFPKLVLYCPHVAKMLEDIGCGAEDRHHYEPVCWTCQRGTRK